MSLVALASRVAFENAVRDRTAAGKLVMNAPKEPLDRLKQRPVIACYTGAMKFDPRGRDLYGSMGQDQTIELIVQIYLPPGNVVVEGLDMTLQDAGAGLAMDLVWRQIIDALADPANPWSEVYKTIVRSYTSFASSAVLVETEKGVRVPAREISLGCKMIPEPSMGQPLPPVWQKIDAALRTDPDAVPVADIIKTMIERPAGMPSWRITQARMGYTDAEIRASGLAPFDEAEMGEAAMLGTTAVDDADQVDE